MIGTGIIHPSVEAFEKELLTLTEIFIMNKAVLRNEVIKNVNYPF